jgi:magnesium transporter
LQRLMSNDHYLYIVDEEERPVSAFIQEPDPCKPNSMIRDVMNTPVMTVPLDADQDTVAEFISKYNLLAAPVVDENNVMKGIVTVDDVVDFLLPPASRKKRRRL